MSIKGQQIRMRVHASQLDAIDTWRAKQEGKPSRAKAIRRLVDLALAAPEPAAPAAEPA